MVDTASDNKSVEVIEIDTSSQSPRNSESSDRGNSDSAAHGTLSNTESALHDTDRSSDSSFVNTKDDTSS
jgi:dynein assembly factor 1, axonemal